MCVLSIKVPIRKNLETYSMIVVYIYINIYMCVYIYIYIYMCVCVCVCVCEYIYIYIYIYKCLCAYTYMNIFILTLNLFDNSYIHVNSNHTSSIIKQVPKAVNMRIRRLSLKKKIFHESCKIYIETLKNSGFKEEVTYLEPKMIIHNNNNSNNDKLCKDKYTTDNCNIKVTCQKVEKAKLHSSTPTFCHHHHHHHHVVPLARISLTLSLATFPYRSSPLAGLLGYIPYPHIAAVCMF